MDMILKFRGSSRIPALFGILWFAVPAIAQGQVAQQTGQAVESAAGEVGQRQTKEQASPASAEPMARINNRINNRVQNRLRNRIDRDYNPQANSALPFGTAEEQARKAGNRKR